MATLIPTSKSVFNVIDLDKTLELKSKSVQVSRASNSHPVTTHTYAFTRMYKITQFNLNITVGGIQSYFASKFRPNIFNVPITIKASGIITDAEMLASNPTVATMLYQEFYLPCRSILSDFIDNLLAPKSRILTSVQSGSDDGRDIMRIVHDTNKGIATSYNSTNIDYTFNYKVYYPILSNQRDGSFSHSSTLDGRVIGIQITAQDKVYSLVKRMIDYVPF